ncbi:cellulase family glycosylhydrolase [Halococcoides cellulosivorans]|uniref:cellulase family glycosylhydrolase n=1 Tax=Halococcoides cellulosivorans TaxID=1679096 RepID=UPI00131F46DF|nr:cellulase family glycosylhydrolase [Halococcoides cellulosivorans]
MTGALAVGGGLTGPASALSFAEPGIESFAPLDVDADNRIVRRDTGEVFKIRGLTVPDPKRVAITEHLRGKTFEQMVSLVTSNGNGWHPRVIRIPVQPIDIGEHPNGNTGPTWGEFAPEVVEDESNEFMYEDRRLQRPPQPPAFTEEQLDTYLDEYLDPAVEHCRERGVYCIVDFHRHWHEQPPGDGRGSGPTGMGPEGDAEAENHLAYDSEYTNYWAYNAFYGTDHPASWLAVDQRFRNNMDDGYVSERMVESGDTPYTQWQVNEALRDEALMFWHVVADRYGEMDHVIFEPYNEPAAPGILGPVEEYGAYKVVPLWKTFVDDFVTPLIDTIREHAPDTHIMMGTPGWCQGAQGVHWQAFPDDNVSITYHNHPGHGVSKEQNWLNEKCIGKGCWEDHETQGLQEAMDVHPVAVTEFGWQNEEYTEDELGMFDVDLSYWLEGTVESYGRPFVEAMESDDRISWVAWGADVRWLPTMFRRDFTINEGDFELTDGSWYDTPREEYPVNCEELPCSWTLWEAPNMGQFVKDTLAEHEDDRVPFPSEFGPTDPDGDGLYEDVNGNGKMDFPDVNELFRGVESPSMQYNAQKFDFDDDEILDLQDVLALFEMV